MLGFEHPEAQIPQLKWVLACGRDGTSNGHDAPAACKFVYKVPIFKDFSYLRAQCIMHRTFNPVCN